MKELREVLAGLRSARAAGRAAAVATIIGVRGSTYRREGARFLVAESGETIGSLSGGCLEGDVQVVAEQVLADGRPRRLRYDLTADEDAVWGLGLGCNGVIDVFIEKAGGLAPTPEDVLSRAIERGERLAVVTVTGPEGDPRFGRRLIWTPDGAEGTLEDAALDAAAPALGREAVAAERGARREVAGAELYAESIQPLPRLIVCGAGHDAIPLVRLARDAGFRPIVVDRREKFLTSDRFPEADGFVRAEFPETAARVAPDDRTYVVVMTHNYLHDKDVDRAFLSHPSAPAYLGLLGPRSRSEKILRELAEEGVAISDDMRAWIYAPVGLDIGAEGPEQIAIAILAEAIAVRAGRTGRNLRDRAAPIHAGR
jgi:xanthine/CO dehydrogenase XdhC/CoxF family maturation factor